MLAEGPELEFELAGKLGKLLGLEACVEAPGSEVKAELLLT